MFGMLSIPLFINFLPNSDPRAFLNVVPYHFLKGSNPTRFRSDLLYHKSALIYLLLHFFFLFFLVRVQLDLDKSFNYFF